MNNLKLYSEVTLTLELRQERESLLFTALDIERNRFFFASSANLIYVSNFASFQNGDAWKRTTIPAEVHPIDLEEGDFITAFNYLMEKEALVVGTCNGVLLLFNVDEKVLEVVGQVNGGVKCISSSPDGDLLSVVSGFGQLFVMTPDWDVLYEMSLSEEQFDGVDVRGMNISAENMIESSISWRGDGKYFATLCKTHDSILSKRIKIWERDSGTLHAATELNDFVGTILEWMPSGAKIAAVHDRKADYKSPEIAFYERNGLPRSSFSINETADAAVDALCWNCNSDLLASIVRCNQHDSVKIWFFSNNHWYLKYEIRYPKRDAVTITWDPIKPLQLICWTLGSQVTVFNFIWTTAVMDNSTAFVIDDSKVCVTPLSLSLMPPPLSLFNLKFPSAVHDIVPSFRNSKSRLAASLADGSLCFADLPPPDIWQDLEGREISVEACIPAITFGFLLHPTWIDSNRVLAVSHCGVTHSDFFCSDSSSVDGSQGYYLLEMELTCSEDHNPSLVTSSGWHANISYKSNLEGLVIGISPHPAKKCSALVQLEGGKILEYTSNLGLTITGPGGVAKDDDISFFSSCPCMCLALVDDNGQLKTLSFGLDDIGRLQVGGRMLCSNCSSFSLYSNRDDQLITHLIFSTKQDFLFIMDVSDIQREETDIGPDKFIHLGNKRKGEEDIHSITIWERGAKVIGVLHGKDASVIMQTTRGNLECIYPRKLVLASIANALMQGHFGDALLLVRRHRIDFNFIVDHCGLQAFLQSASDFVKQVNNLSYITEFVCAIKDVNIIETLYRNYVPLPCPKNAGETCDTEFGGTGTSKKISSVLLAIRKALEEHVPESPARELCILTTLARSDPPAFEEALKRIKVTRDMELSGSNNPRRISYPSAEEALKHLLWLSDPEAVFDAALGLYDLNLAAIVALNSQRDPKEFLPNLQELQGMPVIMMRYNIDLRLHRFENALRHIVAAGDSYFPHCMDLLSKNHQLFPLALQLIVDPAKRIQVLEAWGNHLSDEKNFEEAATTYLCCNKLEKAFSAYRNCGNWKGVLTVAGLLKMGKDAIMNLAHALCEELQALGKHGEAAKIAIEYCGDVNSGISLLITAREWEEAFRIAFMHMQDDLISEVKNAPMECAGTLISEYEEGLEKIGKYLTRYLAVRQRRLLLAAKLQLEEPPVDGVDDDTASEASSNFSGMSAYTTGTRAGSAASVSSSVTSRARGGRRQRNRGKIRAGSPGEELALVEHLRGMSLTAGAMQELKSLLVSLLMFGNEETARKLQHVAELFQLSQMAAVRLAEKTMSSDTINEQEHTLEHYIKKIRNEPHILEQLSWRSQVLVSL